MTNTPAKDLVACRECLHVFPLPAVARCPQCNGTKVRRHPSDLAEAATGRAPTPRGEAIAEIVAFVDERSPLSGEARDRLVELCLTLYAVGRGEALLEHAYPEKVA